MSYKRPISIPGSLFGSLATYICIDGVNRCSICYCFAVWRALYPLLAIIKQLLRKTLVMLLLLFYCSASNAALVCIRPHFIIIRAFISFSLSYIYLIWFTIIANVMVLTSHFVDVIKIWILLIWNWFGFNIIGRLDMVSWRHKESYKQNEIYCNSEHRYIYIKCSYFLFSVRLLFLFFPIFLNLFSYGLCCVRCLVPLHCRLTNPDFYSEPLNYIQHLTG